MPCRRSFRPASTTRRSCGRAKPGSTCTSLSFAAPRAWAWRRRRPIPTATRSAMAHCDVLVVGAGPAGIAAALAAADLGARVMLCDEQAEFGGSLLGDGAARIDGADALLWVQQSVAALAKNPRVTLLDPHHGVRLFPAQLRRFARAAHRSSRDAAGSSAARAAVADSRRAVWCSPRAPSNGLWCFRATIGRESCWPALRKPI